MDKLTLNNQIVSMRHETRKAKLHTINNLIRESRKLKIKNGSEEQKKKNNRKAERFMEEVLIIKKLKDDEVSKFALCNTKKSSDIIADPAASIKDKALARLCSHPSVLTSVIQFRTEFPTWDHIVPQLLLKLGDKKGRKRKNKKSKTHDNEKRKTKSFKGDQTKLVKSCMNDSISDKDQTSTALNPDETTLIHNQDRQQKVSIIAQKIQDDPNEKVSRESVILQRDNSAGIGNEVNVAERSLAELKRFTVRLKAENNTENNNLVGENSTCVSPHATTVDPFFVYEDGKTEYLTSVKVGTNSSDGTGVHNKERLSKQPSWNKNDERRFFQAEKRRNMHGQKPKNSNFRTFQQQRTVYNYGSKREQSSFLRQKMNVVHHKKQSQTTDNNGPIHPSWEAKKKLKEQQSAVFAFQGKKIKFND